MAQDTLNPELATVYMAIKMGIPTSMMPQDVRDAIAHISTAPKEE